MHNTKFTMKQPTNKTIKQLFAKSGNLCAFPKCNIQLVDEVNRHLIGEICHIKARSPEGPRYDSQQNDTERNSYDNLIILCPNHHKIIDNDPESYTIERLKQIKQNHESKQTQRNLKDIDDDIIGKFLIKLNISQSQTIYDSNIISPLNPIGGQYAKVIQNFNTPIGFSSEQKLDVLLSKFYSQNDKLSKNISELLSYAMSKNDSELIEICKRELNGIKDYSKNLEHRKVEVFISLIPISNVVNMSIDDLWRDFKSKPDTFIRMDMLFSDSVPIIENNIESNRYNDPYYSYLHLVKKNKELFPDDDEFADLDVNIYCKPTMYQDLLTSIRVYLANQILNRLK